MSIRAPLWSGLATLATVLAWPGTSRADGPLQLPPPPPPPLSQPSSPPPAPASSPPASAPKKSSSGASSSSATASASASNSTTTGDGAHAFDPRFHLELMAGLSTDYLDFGLGLRGGKSLDNHIYLGASFINHFIGEGEGYGTGSLFYLGPEGGYDFDLKAVVLRAYLGLGFAFFNYAGGTANRFIVWPGASVIWNIPASSFFIGGDVRFVSVPNGPAVGFFAMGGLHFGS